MKRHLRMLHFLSSDRSRLRRYVYASDNRNTCRSSVVEEGHRDLTFITFIIIQRFFKTIMTPGRYSVRWGYYK